jgi:hypothetical protein
MKTMMQNEKRPLPENGAGDLLHFCIMALSAAASQISGLKFLYARQEPKPGGHETHGRITCGFSTLACFRDKNDAVGWVV